MDKLNLLGKITRDMILKLPDYYNGVNIDHFVVMPNHVHLILVLEESDTNLNQIIAQYKSGVSREIHKIDPDTSVWQRSYHDHVIRNQASYEKIWNYIDGNPLKWKEDCFYIDTALIN